MGAWSNILVGRFSHFLSRNGARSHNRRNCGKVSFVCFFWNALEHSIVGLQLSIGVWRDHHGTTTVGGCGHGGSRRCVVLQPTMMCGVHKPLPNRLLLQMYAIESVEFVAVEPSVEPYSACFTRICFQSGPKADSSNSGYSRTKPRRAQEEHEVETFELDPDLTDLTGKSRLKRNTRSRLSNLILI